MRRLPGMFTLVLCINKTELPAIFTDADTKIKGVQIGDHENRQ